MTQVSKYFNDTIDNNKSLALAQYIKDKLPIAVKKAVLSENLKQIRYYFSIGADANYIYNPPPIHEDEPILGFEKRTLLHIAICLGYNEVAEILIRNNARVIAYKGDTIIKYNSLHCAAFWLRAKVAKLLIEHGEDRHVRNCHQETPADEVGHHGYSVGDNYQKNLIETLEYSLRTNKNWEAALLAEEERDSDCIKKFGRKY